MNKIPKFVGLPNVSGIVKNGTSGFSSAVAGSDFQSPITLTTTGTSGVASFSSGVLNIPNYGDSIGAAGSSGTSGSSGSSGTSGAGTISNGTSGYYSKFTGSTTLSSGLIYDNGSTIYLQGNTDLTGTLAVSSTLTTNSQLAVNNNMVIYGSNKQIQWDAAASSDLFISCIPGTRVIEIRNGNSGSPNYAACGLITGSGSFKAGVSIDSGGDNLTLSRSTFASHQFGVGTVDGINGLQVGVGSTTWLSVTESGIPYFKNNVYQTNASGSVSSNQFSTYNGGSIAMKFNYNSSGSVVWSNGSDRMTLTSDGYLGINTSPSYPLHVTSTIASFTGAIINTSGSNNAGLLIKAGVNSGNEILVCQKGNGSEIFKVDTSGEITSTNGEIYFKRSAFANYGHIYCGSDRHFYVRNSGAYNLYLQTNGTNQVVLQSDGVTTVSNLRTSTLYSEYTKNLSGAYSAGTYYTIADSSQLTASGVYMIVAYVDTYAIGGGIYFCTFASVPFYWFAGSSNSNSAQTLPTMYGTGHHNLTPPTIRLRLDYGGNGGKQYIEFDPNANWSNVQGTGGATVTFYIKRIGS